MSGTSISSSGDARSCVIPNLDRRERRMLREFAVELRERKVRNPVARKALDRAADQLESAAAEHAAALPFAPGRPQA